MIHNDFPLKSLLITTIGAHSMKVLSTKVCLLTSKCIREQAFPRLTLARQIGILPSMIRDIVLIVDTSFLFMLFLPAFIVVTPLFYMSRVPLLLTDFPCLGMCVFPCLVLHADACRATPSSIPWMLTFCRQWERFYGLRFTTDLAAFLRWKIHSHFSTFYSLVERQVPTISLFLTTGSALMSTSVNRLAFRRKSSQRLCYATTFTRFLRRRSTLITSHAAYPYPIGVVVSTSGRYQRPGVRFDMLYYTTGGVLFLL